MTVQAPSPGADVIHSSSSTSSTPGPHLDRQPATGWHAQQRAAPFFVGWDIRDAQRHEQAPRLTAQQAEALELLEGIANDPSFYLQMEFQPGDIQLLNNAKILHAREAHTDYDDPAERRHLLRLWLTAHAFASVEDTLRSGIPARRQED